MSIWCRRVAKALRASPSLPEPKQQTCLARRRALLTPATTSAFVCCRISRVWRSCTQHSTANEAKHSVGPLRMQQAGRGLAGSQRWKLGVSGANILFSYTVSHKFLLAVNDMLEGEAGRNQPT